MTKNRLEAFSDGVLAIIITIMVLEMKIPHGDDLSVLKPILPVFISYIVSFVYVGIYWNNHHHMMHVVSKVNGRVLLANLHLLFWISLFPFTTAWIGENHFSTWPVALYGFVLFMASVAWYILARILMKLHGSESAIAHAYGQDWKGKLSSAVYLIAILIAFYMPIISFILYCVVAAVWILPDYRIEKVLKD